jgi:hypothetical protein
MFWATEPWTRCECEAAMQGGIKEAVTNAKAHRFRMALRSTGSAAIISGVDSNKSFGNPNTKSDSVIALVVTILESQIAEPLEHKRKTQQTPESKETEGVPEYTPQV